MLSLQPTFWTRIIVSRKPGQHTPPQLFDTYLRWSRNLQIEVYVGNVRNERLFPSERPLVREYTRILLPHLSRCKVIDYEVQYSTSLPCLVRDLRNLPPFLESLRLKSEQIMDSEAALPANEHSPEELYSIGQHVAQTAQPFTSLNHLALNGRNFLLSCAYLPELIINAGSILIENYRRSLHLHPEIESLPFQFLGMLTILASNTRVKDIRFVNLEFQDAEDIRVEVIEMDTPPLAIALQIDKMELNNVHELMVIQFLEYTQLGVRTLVILDSIFFSRAYPNVSFLFRRAELRNMHRNDVIYVFLWHWNGSTLSLRDCPGLTDDIILRLGIPSAGAPVPLRELEIHNCHNFSVRALKKMMELRHRHFKSVFEGQFQSALLASQAELVPRLIVRGAMEQLADEDRRWFNELDSLCHFEWHTHPLALQANIDMEMEDDTELESEISTAGDVYSHIQEELDDEWYTASELIVDWPLCGPSRPPSPMDSDDSDSSSMDLGLLPDGPTSENEDNFLVCSEEDSFFLTDDIQALFHSIIEDPAPESPHDTMGLS